MLILAFILFFIAGTCVWWFCGNDGFNDAETASDVIDTDNLPKWGKDY